MKKEPTFEISTLFEDKKPIHKFVIWDNGHTAYLKRKTNHSTSWERVNLKSKVVYSELNPSFQVANGITGNNNKFWTNPEGFSTLVCLDRDLRPIFLSLSKSPLPELEDGQK